MFSYNYVLKLLIYILKKKKKYWHNFKVSTCWKIKYIKPVVSITIKCYLYIRVLA